MRRVDPAQLLVRTADDQTCHPSSTENKFLVSKETLGVGGRVKHENLVLSKELIKVELPP